MEEFVFDLTINIGSYKVGITINQVIDFVENVFVKLCGVDNDDHFKNKQIPLNEKYQF